MSHTQSLELFEALQAAGFATEDARKVTGIVLAPDMAMATKADIAQLRTDMADLKSALIKWNVGTLVAMTAISGGLVTVLKLFA